MLSDFNKFIFFFILSMISVLGCELRNTFFVWLVQCQNYLAQHLSFYTAQSEVGLVRCRVRHV